MGLKNGVDARGPRNNRARGPRNNGGMRNNWDIPKRAKWRHLYDEDENFRLWFHNLARGSPTTAIERARVLYRFLGWMGWDLDDLTRQLREAAHGLRGFPGGEGLRARHD